MARSVIAYDKDLPEVSGRLPWMPPTSHLVKDDDELTGWREEEGRRPSKLLLVPKIRVGVEAWRESDYAGASEVTRRLFTYWFDEDHEVPGFPVPFRYYFCQREAIETLVWLIEIERQRDAKALIEAYGASLAGDISFETGMDGARRLRRFVPELNADAVQELPPRNLRRFAFGMATGAGKTWVMAMVVVWSRFHKLMVSGSDLSTNFLVVAPNVIVRQRLEKDFADNRIFHQLPLVPPEWRQHFTQKVILPGDAADPSGPSLFLTNIQQIYEARGPHSAPANMVDALLGAGPMTSPSGQAHRSVLDRVKALDDLVVINDEAHHVHDEKLAWHQSLVGIHEALPNGVGAWLDYSATPWDQRHAYFPWTVGDYPLAQAVEDRIVKAPLIVTKEADKDQPPEDPNGVTKDNVAEKYSYWLQAAVQRWNAHLRAYSKLEIRPVLFIMAEGRDHADAIGEYLWRTPEFRLKRNEVLVIHTDRKGEIRKRDIEAARVAARDIDSPGSKIKVIVSVLMLREGWDVRNVSVVLGLRPFTAKAEILPPQVVGRGLRLMRGVSPDQTQTLEVLGTRNLLQALRNQLEAEGVGVVSTPQKSPSGAVTVRPVKERLAHDITVPITKPSLKREIRKLADLDVERLAAIYDQEELDEPYRITLKMEFATPEIEVAQIEIAGEQLPPEELLTRIVSMVATQAKLPNRFAELYPIVRKYVQSRCFGGNVDLEDGNVRSQLSRPPIQRGIAGYLARKIADLTLERREIAFEKAAHALSETRPFHWRRNLPPLKAEKTVFNYVATYNNFERQFAEFLDRTPDILRFAALGTTEQGASGATFRVDYVKPSGAIGFYYPDWVAVQREMNGEIIHWVIETKGRVWEGTEEKDDAMYDWCQGVSRATGETWKYIRVNQAEFRDDFPTFRVLIFTVVGNAITRKREASDVTVTTEEILQWRDEGRKWQ